jgi:phosphatidylserine decarboxylase
VVTAVGEATKEGLIQAKGIRYSLEDLVQDPALAAELDGGTSLTIYLRPRDYHRIHSPVQGRLRSLRHIPGTVFPVKPYMVRNLKGLFTRNERVVLEIETQWGRVVMVCVAAAGVGNISTVFTGGRCRTSLTDLDVAVGKGEEIAAFKLGSTVILVFPPGKVALGEVQPGQEVRVGQAVAQFVRRAPDGDKH